MATKTEDKVERIIEQIKSQYGEERVNRGDEEPPVTRISTRSPELDYATGGGIPRGRWSRLYGPKSSGKSVKCLHVIAQAQAEGDICAYYNAEKQFTADFAEKQGVDVHNLILLQGTIIEDIGETMEGLMADVDLHCIDSCSSTVTRVELEDGLNEREYMAIRPRKWAQQFAFVNERFDRHRNTVILVDQIRTKIGRGPHEIVEPPGGKFMEHVSSMTLQFTPGKKLWYDSDDVLSETENTKQKTLSKGSEADGIQIKAQVVKSRVCRPFRRANMKFDFNLLEFDHTDELVKAAQYFDMVGDSKGWIKMDGWEKAIRPREFRAILETDDALRLSIVEKMNERA